MSMNRNDALKTLAAGVRKFEGFTAGQLLDSDWSGLKGLHPADLAFFRTYSERPCRAVASACQDRARLRDPLAHE